MKFNKKLLFKKRVTTIALCGSLGVIALGAIIGGNISSSNANPYRQFYRAPVSDTTSSMVSSMKACVENGAQLLLLPGFTLSPPLNAALKDPYFNKTGFVLIDDSLPPDQKATSQVATIQFRTDIGSFISGIALAQYLNNYQDYFLKDDNKLTYGMYGGMNFPSVTSFMGGFQQGIKYFNENIIPKDTTKKLKPIEMVKVFTKAKDYFAGGFGPNDGDKIIDEFLTHDIDCLIPVAGPQSFSAAAKISSLQKRTIIAGVDSALEENPYFNNLKLPDSGPNTPKSIVAMSSLKNINLITPKVMQIINTNNQFGYIDKATQVGGFGVNTVANLDNEGVGVSKAGEQPFLEALKLINPQLTDYNSAINFIEQQPEFKKISSPVDDKTPKGDYGMAFWVDDSYAEYNGLAKESSVYPKNPTQVPEGYNMSQSQWEEKNKLNLVNFIKPGVQSDDQKIKIILSTSASVLLDHSFSESAYVAIYNFFKKYKINIPAIPGKE